MDDDELLMESLKGIVIVAERDLSSVQGSDGLVVVAGLDVALNARLSRLGQAWIGKPVSLKQLRELEFVLERVIQNQGNPVSDVFLPPQEITSGIVTFAVRERFVSELTLKGTVTFGKDTILEEFRSRPGKELDSRTVTEDLQWLNQNPFRRVDLLYADGAAPELAKLQLLVNEQNPWRFYTGYNNYSSERVGDHRLFAGVQLGNLWNAEHQLYVQAITALNTEELTAVSANYVVPLPWRHIVEFIGSSSESSVNLPNDLDLSGDIWRIATTYRVPLPARTDLRQEWSFGAEYQENAFALHAADGRSRTGSTKIFNVSTGHELHHGDRFGATSLEVDLIYSPGILGATDDDYGAVRAGAQAEYWVARFQAERYCWLPFDSTLYVRVAGQYADQPLLATERYAPTGYAEVRGYDESSALADRALRTTLEWRSKGVRTPLGNLAPDGRDRLQCIAFWDFARLENENALTPGPLHSVGPGFRYQWNRNLTVKTDLGFPLRDLSPTLAEDSARLHVSATWSF